MNAEGSFPFNWGQLGAVTVPVVNDLVLLEMTIGTVLGAKHHFLVHTEWLHSDKYFQRNVFRQRTTSACIQEWLCMCRLEKCLLLIFVATTMQINPHFGCLNFLLKVKNTVPTLVKTVKL